MRHAFCFLAALSLLACGSNSTKNASREVSDGSDLYRDGSDNHQCGQDTAQGATYTWCIDLPKTNANADVIFYFHGLNGNASSFMTRYPTIQDSLSAHGAAPTIISISFGPIWFVTDEATKIHPALHQLLATQVIPQMEARLVARRRVPIRHRLIMGESMGGFNAAELVLKNGSLFSRAVLLCPAFSTLSPFASDQDLGGFLSTHPFVSQQLLTESRSLSSIEFPTLAIWNADNPLNLISNLSSSSPPLYVSSGTHDEWGFYDGAVKFETRATQQNANVTWVSIPDLGHCVQTEDSTAKIVSFISDGMSGP